MKEACLNARKSIDIEQYILERDDIGQEFLEIFINKKKEGVRIRILCDMAGSYSFYASSLPETLRSVGIEVRFFNVIKPWRLHTFFSWFFRDHRKLLIVDESIGFVGGVGIRSDMRGWRDTHLRVLGSIISEMILAFDEMWHVSGETKFIKRLSATRKFVKGFQFVTNSPLVRRRFFYNEFITAIRSAERFIYITTPYFIPDRRLRRVLRLAARRGVDVRILIPKTSDFVWVDRASHTYFEKLLGSGVRIFQYTGDMLHAKTAVVDENWATVGSFNLDSLSMRFNYEANIVGARPEFTSEIRSFFEKDALRSEEVLLTDWQTRSRQNRFFEFLSLPIRRFL